MKKLWVLLLTVVAMLSFASGAFAAPNVVQEAAEKGLANFKNSEKGNAGRWGLTEVQLANLTLGSGYHMVTLSDVPAADVMDKVQPFERDHYMFHLMDGSKTALAMKVVDMPAGWQAVSWIGISPSKRTSHARAMGLAKAQGLSVKGETQVFTFRGQDFWLFEAGGKRVMYPVLGENTPPDLKQLGVTGKNLVEASGLLKQLDELPVPSTEAGGGFSYEAPEQHTSRQLWLGAVGYALVGGLGLLAIRRRVFTR